MYLNHTMASYTQTCSSLGVGINHVSRLSSDLLYMPYLKHQIQTLQSRATIELLPIHPEHAWQSSNKGKGGGRVENFVFRTERMRRVRVTYFDAGDGVQAFNSLCYPEFSFDIPLLGIDLLAFGKNKILCVVDFQPITADLEKVELHTSRLAPIRKNYSDLCHPMTAKYFDAEQFFSPHLILFKSDSGPSDPALEVPNGRLFQVFDAYLQSYLDLLDGSKGDSSSEGTMAVKRGQAAYDRYSADRDPAVKLFSTYFGQEWSESFTDAFLFPLANFE